MDQVSQLLLANRQSFHDDAVDRFADLWTQVRP
jgi:hypothetical protein